MKDSRIIQIIPAPDNIVSVYEDGEMLSYAAIICLALVEDQEGNREVKAITLKDNLISCYGDEYMGIRIKNRQGTIIGKLEEINKNLSHIAVNLIPDAD